MRLAISQLAICEICELDRSIGDFVIGDISHGDLEAFPIILAEHANDEIKIHGIKTYLDYLGAQAFIDVFNPMRFYDSQVSAILGHVTDTAALEFMNRKRFKLSGKLNNTKAA